MKKIDILIFLPMILLSIASIFVVLLALYLFFTFALIIGSLIFLGTFIHMLWSSSHPIKKKEKKKTRGYNPSERDE